MADTKLSSKLREITKHGLVYGVGVALNSLLGFVLIPLYTSKFTTEMYGIFSLITLVGTLMGSLLYLGASSSLARYYFDSKNDEERTRAISSVLLLTIIGGIIQIIAGFLFSKTLSNLLFDTNIYSGQIIVSLITSSFTFVNTTYLLLLRNENKSLVFILLNSVSFVISVIFVLLFFKLGLSLYAPFLGLAVAQIFLFIFLFIYYSRYSLWYADKMEIKRHLKYGMPIAFSSLIFYLLEWSDRFFLKEMTSLDDVGIYSYGYKLAMAIHALVIIPFSLIWSQIRMKYKEDNNTDVLFSLVTTYFSVLCLLIIFSFTLFSKELVLITSSDESYYPAQTIIPVIVIAQFFFGLTNIFDYGIAISNKSIYFFYIGVSSLIINLILNYFSVPIWGIYAAAYAKLATYIFYFGLIYRISSKTFTIKIEYRRLIPLCLVMIGLLIIRGLYETEIFYMAILSKFSVLLIILIYLGVVFINRAEKSSIIKYFRRSD